MQNKQNNNNAYPIIFSKEIFYSSTEIEVYHEFRIVSCISSPGWLLL